ncbi:FGFR1 oncogene partner 2 homolog [Drosophila elegans]|uniref:FGFR1 oncogene partner 2 homolog n=1 Tax=Drosophila elegans TaxID=30023 RepID=UPI0007E6A71C|nr:FGFR1 oncogene partner 2 homolog [Drosophila elegans]
MDGLKFSTPGGVLINGAKHMTENLGELEIRTDELLNEAEHVNQDLANCRMFREEQLLKHLATNNSDEEQMEMLRDNMELKVTAEEFHQGIELIMDKYRQHCEGDMFVDSYQLRERYMARLEQVVKEQDARIEHMVEVIKLTAELEDRSSDENQGIIRQLIGENEQMRRQLQISSADQIFHQGSLGSSESSTQIELSASTDPDASGTNSISSLESFLSCLSPVNMDDDDCSSSSSLVSQLEVNRFIEEALAEDPMELPPIQAEKAE